MLVELFRQYLVAKNVTSGNTGAVPTSVFPMGKALLAMLQDETNAKASASIVTALCTADDNSRAQSRQAQRLSARQSSQRARNHLYTPQLFEMTQSILKGALTGIECYRHSWSRKAGHSATLHKRSLTQDRESVVLL